MIACLVCKKEFSPQSNGPLIYCSKRCYGDHRNQVSRSTLKQRFAQNTVAHDSGCLIWTGAKAGKGYGKLMVATEPCYAHRISYEMSHGPIPDDMCVLHRCDNPPCVNPAHLFLGDRLDNATDARQKNRIPRGEQRALAKLTAQSVTAMRDRYARGDVSFIELGYIFGVAPQTAHKIVRRKSWAHVT